MIGDEWMHEPTGPGTPKSVDIVIGAIDITDIVTAEEALGALPCPDSCTLSSGHVVDCTDDEGGACRIHDGPNFGPLLSAGIYEFVHSPGTYVRRVALTDDTLVAPPAERLSPAFLREHAVDALAAAEWLEGP